MIISEKDVRFKAVRASGPGGQKAGRRSTKVELWVRVADLPLNERQKKIIRTKLANHINENDEIWLQEEEERSQALNRSKALKRLNQIIEEAIVELPPRFPTEPPRRAVEIRLQAKKIKAAKKRSRRNSKKLTP
jgi:ribosome-associated protein